MTNIIQFPAKSKAPEILDAPPAPRKNKAKPRKIAFGDLLRALSVATFVMEDQEDALYILRQLERMVRTGEAKMLLDAEGQKLLARLRWRDTDWNEREVRAFMRSQGFP